eukprot:scaffold85860_cov36-Tisochrysis_lutea.AAC.1
MGKQPKVQNRNGADLALQCRVKRLCRTGNLPSPDVSSSKRSFHSSTTRDLGVLKIPRSCFALLGPNDCASASRQGRASMCCASLAEAISSVLSRVSHTATRNLRLRTSWATCRRMSDNSLAFASAELRNKRTAGPPCVLPVQRDRFAGWTWMMGLTAAEVIPTSETAGATPRPSPMASSIARVIVAARSDVARARARGCTYTPSRVLLRWYS